MRTHHPAKPFAYSVRPAVEAPGGALSRSRRTEGKERRGRLRQSQQLFRAAWEDAGGTYIHALLTEEPLAAAREAVASFLATNRCSHATDVESVPVLPKIPPSPVTPQGMGEFPAENPEPGWENPQEAKNGL